MTSSPLFTLYHYGSVIWDALLRLADVFMLPMNSPEFAVAINLKTVVDGANPFIASIGQVFNGLLRMFIGIAGDKSLFEFVLISLPVLLVFSMVTSFVFKFI